MQRQNAVSAYFTSKQILPLQSRIGFTVSQRIFQNGWPYTKDQTVTFSLYQLKLFFNVVLFYVVINLLTPLLKSCWNSKLVSAKWRIRALSTNQRRCTYSAFVLENIFLLQGWHRDLLIVFSHQYYGVGCGALVYAVPGGRLATFVCERLMRSHA